MQNKKSIKKLKIRWNNKYFFFNSFWYVKFTNQLMRKGRKELMEKVLFLWFKQLKSITTLPHTFIFEIFFLIKSPVTLKWMRKGETFHQAPKFVTVNRQYRLSTFLFSKCIVSNNRKKNIKMQDKLYLEMLNIIFNKTGDVLIYKENQYLISIYNQSFAKFNW